MAANIPPTTVVPIICLLALPAPELRAKGKVPTINAKEVITMGLNLKLAASIVASKSYIPSLNLSIANSTIKIAFFADNPTSVISPTWK